MRLLSVLIALAALSCAQPAGADALTGTLKKIRDSNRLILGVRDTAPPFSYIDQNQKVVGFAIDICMRIADAVKRELKMPGLEVGMEFVNSSSRIPLITNGTVDLECGTTTNNAERKKQVSFTNTHFLTATRFVSKKDQHIVSLDDLRGKSVASVAGSTNILMLIWAVGHGDAARRGRGATCGIASPRPERNPAARQISVRRTRDPSRRSGGRTPSAGPGRAARCS